MYINVVGTSLFLRRQAIDDAAFTPRLAFRSRFRIHAGLSLRFSAAAIALRGLSLTNTTRRHTQSFYHAGYLNRRRRSYG